MPAFEPLFFYPGWFSLLSLCISVPFSGGFLVCPLRFLCRGGLCCVAKSRCTPLDIKTIVVFPSHPLSLSTSKSQHTTQLHYNKHQFTSSKCVISQHTHTHAYVRKRQKRGKNISYDYLQNNTSKIQFPTLTKFHSEKKLYQGKKYPKSFQTNIFEPLQNSFARKQKLPTNKGKLFKQMISDYFFSHNDIPNLSGGQLNIKKIFLSPQCKNADIRV
eukprot:TRINITY_DN2659_c1_g2_i1.p1 TRINITY_DN2659_c1_g2~~TRINITY_DN2659_c1_g2_i1.p1  ORF type:complete len:216 (+),score=-7.42 TRINITY_DN2659_c1_g2_i1:1-648(+)